MLGSRSRDGHLASFAHAPHTHVPALGCVHGPRVCMERTEFGVWGLQTEGSARHILSGDKLPTRLIAVTLALVRWPRQLSYTEPVVLETG